MKTVQSLVMLAAALAAAGCVSTSDFEAAQRQIAELQEQLASIKRTASSKEEVQNVNVRIAEQTETLLKSNATLVAKVAQIEERIGNTQEAAEQAGHRIDRFSGDVAAIRRDIEDLKARVAAAETASAGAATGGPATTSTTPATGTEASGQMTVPAPARSTGDPTQVYQAAYRDYQRGNFDLAIEGFREFLDVNNQPDLADNASYWIGESLFSQKKYQEAIEQFDSVVTKYPKSDKVPGALLKKGYSYINIGERAQGVVQLQYVVHEHPRSQEAGLARQKLKQLGIETR
ncbi:MAG TPA: tol-pal system protein YbgF [Thermoanaerobaculia bacterium]|nr:tol-pal system protein YbgF [Thermoanaerobaculia bacterium]